MQKGPKELKNEVLARGLCTVCGMCVGLCPYLKEMGENVAFVAECSQNEGRCYQVCPRTKIDLPRLRTLFAHASHQDPLLGAHSSVLMSRSKMQSLRKKGQYGATVTALLLHALNTGRIDSALLTRWPLEGDPVLARPYLARTPDEIRQSAGSKYTACPSLKLLNTPMESLERLAVVGRPCQITALRKRMLIEDPSFANEKIVLAIGLFCMWSLSYRKLSTYLKVHLKGKRVQKMDIPKGRFLVTSGSQRMEFPHDHIRSFSREACLRCFDFTAELADISVGSTEWKTAWNTLIIRSETGRELVDEASKEGWIETRPFPEEKMQILRDASRAKKLKVIELLQDDEERTGIRSYLQIEDTEKERLRHG